VKFYIFLIASIDLRKTGSKIKTYLNSKEECFAVTIFVSRNDLLVAIVRNLFLWHKVCQIDQDSRWTRVRIMGQIYDITGKTSSP